MKMSKALVILSILVILLAAVEAGAGLFWQGGSGPFSFTTLHGQSVQINGRGVYSYDTSFKTPILQGTDAFTLLGMVPLLVVALIFYSRGSLRGGILLAGVLSYMLYNSASMVFGVAYNNLFLLYDAYFSTSLFAFVLACTVIDRQVLSAQVSAGLPRRGMAALLFVAGLAVLAAWLGDILGALAKGQVPAIASYTTEVTYAVDLGIIVPACILGGVLLLRRAPLGILVASVMAILLSIVGFMVAAQTVAQSLAGINLTPGEFIGKAGSFMVLSLIAIWMLARLFRALPGRVAVRKMASQEPSANLR